MKIIDLINKIANGEIKDKTKFRINWGDMYRDFYYDDSEENQLQCLKNCSDNCSLYDDIRLNDEVEIIGEENIEEEKKIPEKIKDKYCSQISKVELAQKYNEIIDYLDYLKSKGE